MPTRTSETLRPGGNPPSHPDAAARDADTGLDAFASEASLPRMSAPAAPAPAERPPAEPAPDAPSGWTDEDFVVTFPEGDPMPDAELVPPPAGEVQDLAGHPPASRHHRTRRIHTREILVVLSVLVLLQAVPTLLWVQGRFARAGVTAIAEEPPAAVESSAGTTGVASARDVILEAPAPPPPVRREERRQPAPVATPATVAAGLLAVDAPVAMQIVEGGRVVGTTEAETIMLPPGARDLEFRNSALGYQVRQTVTLQAGRTTRLQLAPPSGRLNVNALPWAEVWIDNTPAGETPIGNMEASIGTREIVFRHPELGERRTTVVVTLKEVARVSVDLRQP